LTEVLAVVVLNADLGVGRPPVAGAGWLVKRSKSTPLQRTSVVRSDRRHDENGARHAARKSAAEAQPFLL